jgi:hypothetical protein
VLSGDVISRLHEQLAESDAKITNAWLGHAGRARRAQDDDPMVLERALVDAAHNEGLIIQRAHEDQPILDSLERSIGTFDMRVTDNPRHLRDTVTAYARTTPPPTSRVRQIRYLTVHRESQAA